jgi:ribosomal protein S18 acetylase RimI-like enzyme
MTTKEHASVKPIRLAMIRDDMEHVPFSPCPPDYALRTYRLGDERRWAAIEVSAGEFPDQDRALQRFDTEFAPFPGDMESRCFILADSRGNAIGTATAWRGHFAGEERGRVHWVGIVPAYQGRGLSRPLLGTVMARLAQDHGTAYLTTRTTNYRAINLYLSFGFAPYLMHEQDEEEGWTMVEQLLHRTIF